MAQRGLATIDPDATVAAIEQAGITTGQAAALAVINEQPGVSQRGVSRALHQTEPSITTLVRRLLAAGLVNRTVDPRDGRTRALGLTARGGAALRAADGAFTTINQHIDGLLTREEIRQVTDALRRLSGDRDR